MSKLSPLKPIQVIRKLKKLGFIGPIPGGRHVRMVHPEKGKIIPIPMHKGKDVSVGLIRAILREIDITPEEWNRL
jgi:predicted RNA binding protein YcfA (HicA-like mRNA interferase family)